MENKDTLGFLPPHKGLVSWEDDKGFIHHAPAWGPFNLGKREKDRVIVPGVDQNELPPATDKDSFYYYPTSKPAFDNKKLQERINELQLTPDNNKLELGDDIKIIHQPQVAQLQPEYISAVDPYYNDAQAPEVLLKQAVKIRMPDGSESWVVNVPPDAVQVFPLSVSLPGIEKVENNQPEPMILNIENLSSILEKAIGGASNVMHEEIVMELTEEHHQQLTDSMKEAAINEGGYDVKEISGILKGVCAMQFEGYKVTFFKETKLDSRITILQGNMIKQSVSSMSYTDSETKRFQVVVIG